MAFLRNITPLQGMSPRGSSLTGFWSTHKSNTWRPRSYCRSVKKLSYSQSLIHSAYDSKTSNYVRCWLHHCIYGNERKMKDKHELITLNEKACWSSLLGILKCQGNLMRSVYRSEKQMHNEHKLITQDEKAWWQVLLEISMFQGNLTQCFRATVNRVRTLSERDRSNELGNRFESSVSFCFLICWPGKCWEITSWWKQGSFA